VNQADALPAPEGSFYPWQMKGARVETRDGRVAGTFVRIEPGGAQDLWVVADGDRARCGDGSTRLRASFTTWLHEANYRDRGVGD
jgi:ribosomal 30S subunit maturation factor RimM